MGDFTKLGTVKEKARWATIRRVSHMFEGTLGSVGEKNVSWVAPKVFI